MSEKKAPRRGILSDFFAAHCPRYATSLAYVTLLSLVPLLLFLAYWLSYIAVFNDVGSAFRAFVVGHFIPDSAAVVGDYLDQFMQRIRDLDWVNAGLFGGVSLLMVHQLSRAFDHIWGVKRPRSLGFRVLLNCLILILAPVFFGAARARRVRRRSSQHNRGLQIRCTWPAPASRLSRRTGGARIQ